MKKKIIVPIVLSSVALLLGGLIYLGISSFPELLESEKSIKAKEAEAPIFVDDTVVVEEDKLFAPNAVNATPSLSGGSEYVPSSNSGDVTYIDAPASSYEGKASVSTGKPSYKEPIAFDSHPFFEVESNHESLCGGFVIDSFETIVEQPIVTNDHASYSSYVEKVDDTAHQEIVKTKKAKVNNKKSVRSNQALIETTLLVIGAVDIFSMILIHRRKHLFR